VLQAELCWNVLEVSKYGQNQMELPTTWPYTLLPEDWCPPAIATMYWKTARPIVDHKASISTADSVSIIPKAHLFDSSVNPNDELTNDQIHRIRHKRRPIAFDLVNPLNSSLH
jgi:hypothetical protein